MNKITILFFLAAVNFLGFSQAPSWAWAKGAGGSIGQVNQWNGSTWGNNLTTDGSGNVYTIGYFATPTMIVGNYTLTNSNNSGLYSNEIFFAKYNASGNVIWAKSLKGDSSDNGLDIVIDAVNNIYITGGFSSPSFTLDTKVLTNSTPGRTDIFIAKYNPSGNIIWAESFGGNDDEFGNAIITDASNNLYITGNFKSQTFNMGAYTLNIDSVTHQNMFIAKFDSSGNILYANSVGKTCRIPIAGSNIVSNGSDIFVTGVFDKTTLILGNDTLHCVSNSDNFFVVKYNTTGTLLWARAATGSNYISEANSIAIDAADNVYITGVFGGNMTVGNDTLVPLLSAGIFQFIAKYSSSGNAVWAKSIGTISNPGGYSTNACITTDINGYVYAAGGFSNPVNNMPPLIIANDTLNNGSPGMDALFVAKYDSSGNAIWGKTAASIKWNEVNEITTDKYGNIFVTGAYDSPTIVFDNDTLHNLNNNEWTTDYFIAKIGTMGVGVEEFAEDKNFFVYPNPCMGDFTINSKENVDEIRVRDVFGHVVYEGRYSGKSISLSNQPKGVYLVEIISSGKATTQKLIIN